MNEELRERLKKIALSRGVELFGVSPSSRLDCAPVGFRPKDYLPDVKSVIVLGAHFPEASALYWGNSVYSYQYYGYAIVNKELGHCAFHISKELERAGYFALPFAPTVYPKGMDYKNQRGEISHRHCAVCAGLGEFGYSGLVLTKEFGTRNRFISILTTAELPYDEMSKTQSLCKRCKKCVEACPNKALREDFEESFEIDGVKFSYIVVDKHLCYYNIMGLGPGSGGIINQAFESKGKRAGHRGLARAILKAFLKKPSDFIVQLTMQYAVDWVDYCGRCLQVCNPNPTNLK